MLKVLIAEDDLMIADMAEEVPGLLDLEEAARTAVPSLGVKCQNLCR